MKHLKCTNERCNALTEVHDNFVNRSGKFPCKEHQASERKRRHSRAYKLFARLATHARVIDEIKKAGGNPIEFPCITSESTNAMWKPLDRNANRRQLVNLKKRLVTWSIIAFCFMLSSCATLFGETNKAHQKHKPMCGEPKREIRVGYLVADILLFPPALIVDLITGKIYHPTPDPKNVKQCEGGAK